MTCPTCGNNSTETLPRRWQQKQTRGYAATAPLLHSMRGSVPSNATYSRKEPVATGDVPHNVWTPFLISVISGTFPTVVTASFLAAIDVSSSTLYGISVGGVVSCVAWYISARAFYRLLWREEKITGNGAGKKSRSWSADESIKVEVQERDEKGRLRAMRWFQLPPNISDDDLEKLARALFIDGKPFSKRGVKGILAAEKFSDIQNALLNGKAAKYTNGKNANGGVELRRSGQEFLKQYLEAGNGRYQ